MSTFIDGSLPRGEALYWLTRQDASSRAFAASWPAPRWMKLWEDGQPEARMVWVNGAYAKWFDVDPHEYVGSSDSAVWPKEACDQFRELDRKAIENPGEVVAGVEMTPRAGKSAYLSRKMACRVDDSGVHGWAIYGEICPVEADRCAPCVLGRKEQ